MLVTGGNERKAVGHIDFVGGKGEAKIGLRESGDSGAEASSKSKGNVGGYTNGEECSLVVVDGKPHGILEDL